MTDIRTLTTLAEAHDFLRHLAADDAHEYVSVFWDRGWGNSVDPAEISVIVDGDGQNPKAYLTADVYRQLVAEKVVGANVYVGGKARRTHDFKAPPPAVKTGADRAEIVERVVRSVMGELRDLPIKATFFRGFNPGDRNNPINEESVVTDGFRWSAYVNVNPGGSDAYVIGCMGFDHTTGQTVIYPKVDGQIDEAALRAGLADAINAVAALLTVETAARSDLAAKAGV